MDATSFRQVTAASSTTDLTPTTSSKAKDDTIWIIAVIVSWVIIGYLLRCYYILRGQSTLRTHTVYTGRPGIRAQRRGVHNIIDAAERGEMGDGAGALDAPTLGEKWRNGWASFVGGVKGVFARKANGAGVGENENEGIELQDFSRPLVSGYNKRYSERLKATLAAGKGGSGSSMDSWSGSQVTLSGPAPVYQAHAVRD